MLTAKVKWIDDFKFAGESGSGHAIVMDASPEPGKVRVGMTPMEMLLVGAGGCSGMDVASILRKKRQEVRDIEVKVSGEKAEPYPQKFISIQLEFTITGKNISEDAVKKAIELSMEKYCSVKATLEESAKIGYTYKVINI
ncbi:MAG TPA: OsmC family protein [Dissulfurispiraceae bacterium]|nr:OsmC family protein [Dissulfurispiraceae bacterium]